MPVVRKCAHRIARRLVLIDAAVRASRHTRETGAARKGDTVGLFTCVRLHREHSQTIPPLPWRPRRILHLHASVIRLAIAVAHARATNPSALAVMRSAGKRRRVTTLVSTVLLFRGW